jgi:uncharacterized protein
VTAAAAAAALLGLTATSAWAHVSVQPSTATGGGFATLAVQVPNETDDANTTKVKVQLPQDKPFASVSVMPKPGWTYTIEKANLTTPVTDDDGKTVSDYISTITWSGGQIKPGEFEDFVISVGPLPAGGTLTFPAIQTYDNGQEVAWIEQTGPDGKEPEHPAPKLTITGADAATSDAGDDHGSNANNTPGSVGKVTTTLAANAPVAATVSTESSSSNGLAIAALVVGALALIVGIVALVTRRGASSTNA